MQDGGGLGRGRLLHRLDVVPGHVQEARRQRAKGRAVAVGAGCRYGCEGAAVERIVRRNDLEGAVLLLAAPLARQLNRRFVRLRAAVLEVDAVHAGVLNEQLSRLHLRHREEDVGDVDKRLGLVRQRLDDDRVAVAQAVGGDALEEVEVCLAGVVPDSRAFAADQGHRQTALRLHIDAALDFLPVGHRSVSPSLAVTRVNVTFTNCNRERVYNGVYPTQPDIPVAAPTAKRQRSPN